MAEKIVRRLGDRLDHIFQWVNSTHPYMNIWDLCCDHGRLGLHLHKQYPSSHVYLVDKVDSIVDKLAVDFGTLQDERLQFLTADATALDIPTDERTLVIVAGVGGQSLVTMLEGVLDRLCTGATLDFMLSPNSHMFEVRAFLRARHFTLIDEAFVTEKQFSHEHLWLQYTKDPACISSRPVTPVGDSIWQNMTDTQRVYIDKIVLHYQRMLDNRHCDLSLAALAAYKRVLA